MLAPQEPDLSKIWTTDDDLKSHNLTREWFDECYLIDINL